MEYREFDPETMKAAVEQNRKLIGLPPQEVESAIENTVAYVLCQNEICSRMPQGLDYYLNEVNRTWKRYIPEAKDLIAGLSKAGITLVTK